MVEITTDSPIDVLTGKSDESEDKVRTLRLSFKLASDSLMSIRGQGRGLDRPGLLMHALFAVTY